MNTRWDYKTVTVKAKGLLKMGVDAVALEQALNEVGVVGWELVSLLPSQHQSGQLVAVLKRPR